MKKTIILLTTILLSISGLRAQDILDQIAEESCQCLDQLNFDSLSSENWDVELGLCILKVAAPYEKQLKRKYGIDFNTIDREGGEELGRMIGLRLATNCPKFMELVAYMNNEEPVVEDEKEYQIITGTFMGVEKEQYAHILINDENGRPYKFLWLGYFQNSNLIQSNPEYYNGKTVFISYEEFEIYIPGINDYMQVKVIKGIE